MFVRPAVCVAFTNLWLSGAAAGFPVNRTERLSSPAATLKPQVMLALTPWLAVTADVGMTWHLRQLAFEARPAGVVIEPESLELRASAGMLTTL